MPQIRRLLTDNLLNKWDSGKVLIVIGPRQVGKTTLIKELCEKEGNYLFLNGDDAADRVLLEDSGEVKLRSIIGTYKTVFIDEGQRIKNIGLLLKIIYDRIPGIRLVVSGSSALEIANEINEPLTGRKWEYNLFPISWTELTNHYGYAHVHKNLPQYLVFGTYPEVINNQLDAESVLKELAGSYLYKDLLQYKGIRKPEILDKLLLALALQLGSEVNYNELSRTIGVDRATIEQYISLLEKAYVIFRINPLSRNIRNELNTNRKIYFYDNGVRNAIVANFKPVELRQDIGALWENFLISERIKAIHYNKWYGRYYFWRTYQQQEIDWIEEIDGSFSLYEFKWNIKSKAKFPKTFAEHYPVEKSMVITPDTIDGFLL